MSSSPNKTRGARFLQRVRSAGKLSVTVLASSKPLPKSSAKSKCVARYLIGGLEGSRPERVNRLAAKLDKLVSADRGSDQLESAPGRAVG